MKTLLVFESDAGDFQATSDLLTAAGWTVISAKTAREALLRLEVQPIDLFITEVEPGEGDAIQIEDLLSAIRRGRPALPIIVYTKFERSRVARVLFEQGVRSWLDKKQDASRLVSVVESVFRDTQQQQRAARLWKTVYEQSTVFYLGNEAPVALELIQCLLDESERFGIVPADQRNRVSLALEEALLNAIIHGNLEVSSKLREEPGHEYESLIEARRREMPYSQRVVRVSFSISRQHAKFVICDEGPGFNTENVPDPRDPERLEIPSGRGLLLMRAYMDDVRFNARGNEVTLIRRAALSMDSEVDVQEVSKASLPLTLACSAT